MPYVRSRQQQRGIRHFENGVDEKWSRNVYGAFCRGGGHRLLSSLHLLRSLMGPGDATPSLSQVIELSPCFTLQVLTSMALLLYVASSDQHGLVFCTFRVRQPSTSSLV